MKRTDSSWSRVPVISALTLAAATQIAVSTQAAPQFGGCKKAQIDLVTKITSAVATGRYPGFGGNYSKDDMKALAELIDSGSALCRERPATSAPGPEMLVLEIERADSLTTESYDLMVFRSSDSPPDRVADSVVLQVRRY